MHESTSLDAWFQNAHPDPPHGEARVATRDGRLHTG
ncbi:hypothetical protein P3T16_004404 [Paraburkholderia sp. GAS42]